MKKKVIWALLALLAVAAVILVIALPRAGEAKNADPEETRQEEPTAGEISQTPETEGEKETLPEEEALPLDSTPVTPQPLNNDSTEEPVPTAEPTPNIDPLTGVELEEDELPIAPP